VWGNFQPDKEPETSGTMAVLDGDTRFMLEVNTLESKAASKAAATELARPIIAKCD